MANSVTLAGYTITFVSAVCNPNNTQTWTYNVSITTPSPPGGEISDWVLQLCSDPVQQVTKFTTPAGITAETGRFRSCLSNSAPPPPITVFNGIKFNGINNNNVAGIYTFTINGCFEQTDVNVAVKTGGGNPSPETCFIGVVTGPSCVPITTPRPTTPAPTTPRPTTPRPTTPRPTTPRPTTPRPTTPRPTTPAPTPTPCSCCFVDERPVVFARCELTKTENFNNITVECTGRFLDVNVVLRNVCPNKFVNIGVLVFEGNRLLSSKVCRFFTDGGTDCIPRLNAGRFCFVFDDESCPPPRTLTVRIVTNYVESGRLDG